jgi:hypothetical protein
MISTITVHNIVCTIRFFGCIIIVNVCALLLVIPMVLFATVYKLFRKAQPKQKKHPALVIKGHFADMYIN